MMTKFNVTNLHFVDTYEAYSKTLFFGGNNVAIPYINIGLMPRNPINFRQSVIDYSYYILIGVKTMIFSASKGELTIDFNVTSTDDHLIEYISVGGYKSGNGAEVEISCKSLIFYLPDRAEINDPREPFLPVDTPNFKQNLLTDEVESFFLKDNLPQEVKEELGTIIYTFIWR